MDVDTDNIEYAVEQQIHTPSLNPIITIIPINEGFATHRATGKDQGNKAQKLFDRKRKSRRPKRPLGTS